MIELFCHCACSTSCQVAERLRILIDSGDLPPGLDSMKQTCVGSLASAETPLRAIRSLATEG